MNWLIQYIIAALFYKQIEVFNYAITSWINYLVYKTLTVTNVYKKQLYITIEKIF